VCGSLVDELLLGIRCIGSLGVGQQADCLPDTGMLTRFRTVEGREVIRMVDVIELKTEKLPFDH